MKAEEAVETMMYWRKSNKITVSKGLGYSSTGTLFNMMHSKNGLRVEILRGIADLLDFDLVLRSRTDGMMFVIDGKPMQTALPVRGKK